mgnify:CR=1 FL=1
MKNFFTKAKEFIKKYHIHILGISVILFISTLFYFLFDSAIEKAANKRYNKYTSYEIYTEMNQLTYDSLKSVLVEQVNSYIQQCAPTSALDGLVVVNNCIYYDIDICFVLAQGEIESHFGTKGLGSKINNVFNVGVFDGKSIYEIDKKYKPDHPNESIGLYLELLTTNYLVGKVEEDLMQNYVDKNGNRYASNPDYESMFSVKYKYICENTKIKEIQDIMHSYAVKCNR